MLEQLPNNAIATTKAEGRNKCLPSFIVVGFGFVVCKITPYFLNEQENGKVIGLKHDVAQAFSVEDFSTMPEAPDVYSPYPGCSDVKNRLFRTRTPDIYVCFLPSFDVLATTNTLASYSIHMGKATSSKVKTSDVGVITAATTRITTTACLR